MAWGPRPRRHTPRPPPPLLASRPERNIAPAGHSTAWLTSSVKEISPLLAQNGQNTALFAVPGRRIFHGTPQHLTRGRFFFHPSPIPTPRRDKTHPARPHQRPSGKKFSQHAQNTPKSALFRLQGEFFLGLTQNPRLQGEFFTLMGATATSQHPPTASPETDDTNAGGSLPRDETTDTTASSLPHTFETADTFARTKQPISGRFPPAKVSRVSCTPRRAPAKALPVSSDVESGLLIRSKVLRHSCLPPFCWPW